MKNIKVLLTISALVLGAASAHAACNVVDGGNKTAFDGSSLAGLSVEKKSLVALDKAFPALKVLEKSFSGGVQTCTDCAGKKHIVCE